MKSSSRRSLVILLALLMVIASFLVYSYLIKPSYIEINKLRGKIASLSANYNTFKSLNEQYNNSLSSYSNANVEQLALALPQNLDVGYAAGQALGLAIQNNLIAQSFGEHELAIKPSGAPLVRNLGTLRMELRAAGSYDNLKAFFKNIDNNILIMNPVSLSIENQAGSSGGANYSIVVDSYYQTK